MRTADIRSVAPDGVLDTDICVIGAGPAGLTIAAELAGSGIEIVLLESGGREPERWGDALNEIENVGAARQLDQSLVRNRALGGSSWTWWGRSAILDPTDFRDRPWVPGSGWPIERESIEPYLSRSAAHLRLGVVDNGDPATRSLVQLPALTDLIPYVWSYSRDERDPEDAMRFGPRATALDLPGVRCYLNATVTQLEADPGGRTVRRVEVAAPDGGHRFVRARLVVLCGGGIENARLLLASDRVAPNGLGNEHDLVGRYLMDHPRGSAGTFRPADFVALQRVLGPFRIKSRHGAVRIYPGVALSPAVQKRERLLNAAAWVEREISDADPLRSLAGLARLRTPARNAGNLLRYAPSAVESLWRTRIRHRSAVRVSTAMDLQVTVEQQPDRNSRVTLAARRDALGVPLSVVDWRVGEPERRTAERIALLFVERMGELGLPAPDLSDWVTDRTVPLPLLDAAHPSGTTRMAADAHDGVVDTTCRVHGVDNLYVAGSSVFPTVGHANPTQMIVALAVRLADHLRTRARSIHEDAHGTDA